MKNSLSEKDGELIKLVASLDKQKVYFDIRMAIDSGTPLDHNLEWLIKLNDLNIIDSYTSNREIFSVISKAFMMLECENKYQKLLNFA